MTLLNILQVITSQDFQTKRWMFSIFHFPPRPSPSSNPIMSLTHLTPCTGSPLPSSLASRLPSPAGHKVHFRLSCPPPNSQWITHKILAFSKLSILPCDYFACVGAPPTYLSFHLNSRQFRLIFVICHSQTLVYVTHLYQLCPSSCFQGTLYITSFSEVMYLSYCNIIIGLGIYLHPLHLTVSSLRAGRDCF